MAQQHFGGSFAPPITPANLLAYRQFAAGTSDEIREAMNELCDMVLIFNETPKSKLSSLPHPSGLGVVTPLEAAEITRIWDAVPWPSECDRMGVLFDSLTGDVRNAAYHLLWYARELTMDREPITTDTLSHGN